MKRFLIALAMVTFVLGAINHAHAQEHTETIEIDLEQTPVVATATSDDTDQAQFMYLIGLASVGLLGIAGVVRDVRKDRA